MILGLGTYNFKPLVKEMVNSSPAGLKTPDTIDELENLVQELKLVQKSEKSDVHGDVMSHLSKINQKIDLIRESVQRLCESTANCSEPTSYE